MPRKINFAYKETLLYYGEEDKIPVAFSPFFWSSPEKEKLFYGHLPFYKYKDKEELEKVFKVKLPCDSSKLQKTHYDLHNGIFNQTLQYPLVDAIVEHNTIDHFLNKGEKMIIPVTLDEPTAFLVEYNNLYIDDYILENIHKGNIIFMFTMHHEGHFDKLEHIQWLNGFGEFFKLNKTNLFFVNSNLASKELCEKYEQVANVSNKFTIIETPYFEHRPWFIENTNQNIYFKEDRIYHYSKFFEFIENNKRYKKESKFLSFNRRLDAHRAITVAQLKVNEHTQEHIASLGAAYFDVRDADSFYQYLKNYHKLENLTNSYQVNKKIKELLNQLPIQVDADTDHINFAANLNADLHRKTFVNIVTESKFGPGCVFFSEKIYKPMYCAQPFLLVGNPFSLKELKKQGYKTFDKWWDESYDEEVDFVKRLNKMEKVYEFIGKKSYQELFEMTIEMEDVLIHNFNTLMSKSRLNELIYNLEDMCDNTKTKTPSVTLI